MDLLSNLTPAEVFDFFLCLPGTGQGLLPYSVRHLLLYPRKARKARLVGSISRVSCFAWLKLWPSPPFFGLIPDSCLWSRELTEN